MYWVKKAQSMNDEHHGYLGRKPSLFLFCIPECMMDDGSACAIFWK